MIARQKTLEYRAFRSIFPYKSEEDILQELKGIIGVTPDYMYEIGLIGTAIRIPAKINEDDSNKLIGLVQNKLRDIGYLTKKTRIGSNSRAIIRPRLSFTLKFGETVGFFAYSEDVVQFYFHDNQLKKEEIVQTIEGVITGLKEMGLFHETL